MRSEAGRMGKKESKKGRERDEEGKEEQRKERQGSKHGGLIHKHSLPMPSMGMSVAVTLCWSLEGHWGQHHLFPLSLAGRVLLLQLLQFCLQLAVIELSFCLPSQLLFLSALLGRLDVLTELVFGTDDHPSTALPWDVFTGS